MLLIMDPLTNIVIFPSISWRCMQLRMKVMEKKEKIILGKPTKRGVVSY